jgi:hypothetical protein
VDKKRRRLPPYEDVQNKQSIHSDITSHASTASFPNPAENTLHSHEISLDKIDRKSGSANLPPGPTKSSKLVVPITAFRKSAAPGSNLISLIMRANHTLQEQNLSESKRHDYLLRINPERKREFPKLDDVGEIGEHRTLRRACPNTLQEVQK